MMLVQPKQNSMFNNLGSDKLFVVFMTEGTLELNTTSAEVCFNIILCGLTLVDSC